MAVGTIDRRESRQNVERLAAAHQLWDDLVRTYESAISSTADTVIQVELLRAVAETHDQRRDAPRDAIAAWEKGLKMEDVSKRDAERRRKVTDKLKKARADSK